MRAEFSKKTKKAAWDRAEGQCEWRDNLGGGIDEYRCPQKIAEYDHILACEFGGDNTLDNCQALCRVHHKIKTVVDIKNIAKSNRLRNTERGITARKGRPIPGSRGSGIRQKMNGQVIRDSKW